ncbi:MAG: 4Fe-4S binding protein [Bacteroidales bacterium]|nr:4Fe-4S binding protein [Bacteroidales bacterium]MDD2425415.1 4Fe-4S binding protein [Bacteroidales bacterium]MDD3988870.1 4Fe-4S binding protein [Bacteroidales bacterium]MDD4639660.1 4Fe-4S binding protein [Bacteroidales bacterium]
MYKKLKWIRVILALLFFLLITLNFVWFANSKASLLSPVLHLQFVPALLGLFTGTAVFFAFLLVITIFFGRVYCSLLCPLGVYQDIVSRIADLFKSKKQRREKYRKPQNFLRYFFALVAFLPLAAGVTLPLALTDPYSNWGRISSEIISLGENLIHNLFAGIFPESVFYRGYAPFIIEIFIFSAFILILVTIMSAFRRRLYCNTVCPAGTLLGAISRFSLFRPEMGSECNMCAACSTVCKSNCIDLKNRKIDVSRCVSCLNCMTMCKRGSVTYRFAYRRKEKKSGMESAGRVPSGMDNFSDDRRRALLTMGLAGTALVARAAEFRPFKSEKEKEVEKKHSIAPPGAQSIQHLKDNCTACHACISVCPNRIIKPAVGEYGLDGLFLPHLDYRNHFCGYDCNACTQICPNHALIPMSPEEKKLCQIGRAKFSLRNCIVFTDKTDCGACDEHCPTKAITMIPYKGTNLYIPKLDRDICIGCGACEYICPARPVKAMIVEANQVHLTAEAPLKEEQEKVKVDDFGF